MNALCFCEAGGCEKHGAVGCAGGPGKQGACGRRGATPRAQAVGTLTSTVSRWEKWVPSACTFCVAAKAVPEDEVLLGQLCSRALLWGCVSGGEMSTGGLRSRR